MAIGIAILVISVLIVAIWVIIEMKRMKHKIFAIFLIALILFLYVSVNSVFKGQDVNWKTVPGAIEATNIYFSWLSSSFGNVKSITTYAVKMDWSKNESSEESKGFFGLTPDKDK